MKTKLSRSIVVLLVILLSFTSLAVPEVKAQETTPVWTYTTIDEISSITISNNKTFVLTLHGEVYCLSQSSGELLWTNTVYGHNSGLLESNNGKVYAGSESSYINCFDENTGQFLWKHKAPTSSTPRDKGPPESIFTTDGKVIVEGDGFSVLDANDGSLLWENDDNFVDLIGVHENRVYTNYFPSFSCFDADTGRRIWATDLSAEHVLFEDDKIFFYHPFNNKGVYCLDSKDGSVNWQYNIDSEVFPLSTSNSSLLFGDSDSYFYSLNKQDGELNWKTLVNNTSSNEYKKNAKPVATEDKVILVNNNYQYLALNLENGSIIWFSEIFPVPIMSLTLGDRSIFVTYARTIMAVDVNSGVEQWTNNFAVPVIPPIIVDNRVFIAGEVGDSAILAYDTLSIIPDSLPSATPSPSGPPIRFYNPYLILFGSTLLLIALGILAYFKKYRK